MRRLFLGIGVFSGLCALAFLLAYTVDGAATTIPTGDACWLGAFMILSAIGFAGSLKR